MFLSARQMHTYSVCVLLSLFCCCWGQITENMYHTIVDVDLCGGWGPISSDRSHENRHDGADVSRRAHLKIPGLASRSLDAEALQGVAR